MSEITQFCYFFGYRYHETAVSSAVDGYYEHTISRSQVMFSVYEAVFLSPKRRLPGFVKGLTQAKQTTLYFLGHTFVVRKLSDFTLLCYYPVRDLQTVTCICRQLVGAVGQLHRLNLSGIPLMPSSVLITGDPALCSSSVELWDTNETGHYDMEKTDRMNLYRLVVWLITDYWLTEDFISEFSSLQISLPEEILDFLNQLAYADTPCSMLVHHIWLQTDDNVKIFSTTTYKKGNDFSRRFFPNCDKSQRPKHPRQFQVPVYNPPPNSDTLFEKQPLTQRKNCTQQNDCKTDGDHVYKQEQENLHFTQQITQQNGNKKTDENQEQEKPRRTTWFKRLRLKVKNFFSTRKRY